MEILETSEGIKVESSILDIENLIDICDNGYKIQELRDFLSGVKILEEPTLDRDPMVDFVAINHKINRNDSTGFFHIEKCLTKYVNGYDTIDGTIDKFTPKGKEHSKLLVISSNRFLIPEVEKHIDKNKYRCTFTSMYDLLKETNCVSLWGGYERYRSINGQCCIYILFQENLMYAPNTNSYLRGNMGVSMPEIYLNRLDIRRSGDSRKIIMSSAVQ